MVTHQEPHGTVRLYPVYQTRLGEAMLPGDDPFTVQLRNLFSEMLIGHLEAGLPRTAISFGKSLSEFTPANVRDAGPDWKARLLVRWEREQRPLIFQALENYLINGGHEARVEMQREFVAALVDAGVQVEGGPALMDVLEFSGDWHATFGRLTQMGRPLGIRLASSIACDRGRLAVAAAQAGFSREQITTLAASL